jgi:tRNA nucleotidyltransferase/poly(A) polymerase
MIRLTTLLAESKLKLNIPMDIKQLHKLFKQNGKQLYVVGGAVRDAILGKTPKDFDLTTDAKPEEVEAIAKQGGYKSVDVGKQFGVVVVNGHEIATFRKDIGKGRRPDAVDYTDIKGDVKRRDLTINALFYDLGREEIVDLVGGLEDIKKKKVRTVGDPKQRFDEDPLRKMRAVRFSGSVGGKMSKSTWNALRQNPSLKGISSERIRDEFIKGILKAQQISPYLKMISKLGMWKDIFPGLKINMKTSNEKDYKVQIANLLKGNHSSTVYMKLKQLSYTNQEVKDIVHLIKLKEFSPKNIYQIKVEQKLTKLKDKQIKMWAKVSGKGSTILKVWKFKLSVDAKEAISQGYKGKQIGDYIKQRETELFNSK